MSETPRSDAAAKAVATIWFDDENLKTCNFVGAATAMALERELNAALAVIEENSW